MAVYVVAIFMFGVRIWGGVVHHTVMFLCLLAHNFTVSFIIVATLRLRRFATVSSSLWVVGLGNLLAAVWVGLLVAILSADSINLVAATAGVTTYVLIYVAVPGCPGALAGALAAIAFTRPQAPKGVQSRWTT
jgi:hypothetical protein